jgi:hypothetical protein
VTFPKEPSAFTVNQPVVKNNEDRRDVYLFEMFDEGA